MTLLEEIKQCEKQASDLKKEALTKSREMNEKVVQDALSEREACIAKAREKAFQFVEDTKKQSETKAKEYVDKSAVTDKKLVEVAMKKIDTAAEYIVKSVENVK